MSEPIILDGAECFEVEEVLAEQHPLKQRQVLVKWTGLDLMDATWEPVANIPQMFVDRFRGLQAEHEDVF